MIPVLFLSRYVHSLCTRTSRQDDCVGRFELIFSRIPLAPVLEWSNREVDFGDGLGYNGRAEPDGLFTKFVHHFGAAYSIRKTREVLDC